MLEAVHRVFGAYVKAAALVSGADRPVILGVGNEVAIEPLPARCRYVRLDLRPASLEDLAARAENAGAFHVFAFAASLDRIDNLDTAAKALAMLAAPGARAVFWNPLHDPDLVAQSDGAAVFGRLASYRFRAASAAAFAGYGATRLPALLRAMKKQRRDLSHQRPLDDVRHRWFTAENVAFYLARLGQVEELTTLPNTHHHIGVVRITR